jgi:hypothetical protein
MNTKQALITCRAREPVGTAAKLKEKSVSGNIKTTALFFTSVLLRRAGPSGRAV